jgi:hypothetical protein
MFVNLFTETQNGAVTASEATLKFTVTATDPDPNQTLTFSLTGPSGALISPTSGVPNESHQVTATVTWTCHPSDAFSVKYFHIRVTDNGSPTLYDVKDYYADLSAHYGGGPDGPTGQETDPALWGRGEWVPIAHDDYGVTPGTAVTGNLLDNDREGDSGNSRPANLHVYSHTDPTRGTVSVNNSTGTFTYTPGTGFTGRDSFTYVAQDISRVTQQGGGVSNTATVTIDVEPFYGILSALLTYAKDAISPTCNCSCACNNEPKSQSDKPTGHPDTNQHAPGAQTNSSAPPEKPMLTLTLKADQGFTPDPDGFLAELLINDQPVANYTFNDNWVLAGDTVQISFPVDAASLPSGQYDYGVRISRSYAGVSVAKLWRSVDHNAAPVTIRNNNDFGLGEGWRLAGVDRLLFAYDPAHDQLAANVAEVKWLRDDGRDFGFPANTLSGGSAASGDDTGSRLTFGGSAIAEAGGYTPFLIRTDRYDTRNLYDDLGRLRWSVDRVGNAAEFTWTGYQITRIFSHADNRNTTFGYSGGKIDTITDFVNRQTTLDYDANGRLDKITQPSPEGNTERTSNGETLAFFRPLKRAATFWQSLQEIGSRQRLYSRSAGGSFGNRVPKLPKHEMLRLCSLP